MSLRASLLALIALATVGFLISTTIERNSGESRHESAATLKAEGKASEAHHTKDETSTTEKTHSKSTPTPTVAAHLADA